MRPLSSPCLDPLLLSDCYSAPIRVVSTDLSLKVDCLSHLVQFVCGTVFLKTSLSALEFFLRQTS